MFGINLSYIRHLRCVKKVKGESYDVSAFTVESYPSSSLFTDNAIKTVLRHELGMRVGKTCSQLDPQGKTEAIFELRGWVNFVLLL